MPRRMLFVVVVAALSSVIGCSDDRLDSPQLEVARNPVPGTGSTGANAPLPAQATDAMRLAEEYLRERHPERFQSNGMSEADEDRWIQIDANTNPIAHRDTFGAQQLRQLLEDRPSMQGIVRRNEFIYRWVVMQFDADTAHDQIRWDSREPQSGRPAENNSSYLGSQAYVRITVDDSISGRDKWLMLVYELHNYKNGAAFHDLWDQAIAGKIDRDTYSLQCVELEFNAMTETQIFFRRHPLPGATAENDPNYASYLTGSGSLDDYIKMLESDDPQEYDPRDYFGRGFDTLSKGWFESWIERLNMRSE